MTGATQSRLSQWPSLIRNYKTRPILGGWGLIYNEDGIVLNLAGINPTSIVHQIVNHRVANKLAPQIERVKAYCLHEWYKKDPKRFIRPPAPIPEPQPAFTPEVFVPLFVAIQNGDEAGWRQYRDQLVKGLEDEGACPDCSRHVRKHAINADENDLATYTYTLYTDLLTHWGNTPKPRPLIEREYSWNDAKAR